MPQSTQFVPLIRHSSLAPWIGASVISFALWSLIIWAVILVLS